MKCLESLDDLPKYIEATYSSWTFTGCQATNGVITIKATLGFMDVEILPMGVCLNWAAGWRVRSALKRAKQQQLIDTLNKEF